MSVKLQVFADGGCVSLELDGVVRADLYNVVIYSGDDEDTRREVENLRLLTPLIDQFERKPLPAKFRIDKEMEVAFPKDGSLRGKDDVYHMVYSKLDSNNDSVHTLYVDISKEEFVKVMREYVEKVYETIFVYTNVEG